MNKVKPSHLGKINVLKIRTGIRGGISDRDLCYYKLCAGIHPVERYNECIQKCNKIGS